MPAAARPAPVPAPWSGPARRAAALRLGLVLAATALLAPAARAQDTPHHPTHPAHPAHPAPHHAAHAPAAPHPAHPHPRPAMHAPQRLVHHAPMPAIPTPAVPAAPAEPAVPAAPQKGSSTGLPLPRYASLRADAVNLRGGPGTRYPIQWVYRRRDLPVRIEREFDVWRLVEDSDGVKGWVHQATLVGTRTFVIPGRTDADLPGAAPPTAATPAGEPTTAGPAPAPATAPAPAAAQRVVGRLDPSVTALPADARALRTEPVADAPLVAVLKPGIVGRIRACPAGSGWCKVSVRDYSGWLPRDALWGLLPDEIIQP